MPNNRKSNTETAIDLSDILENITNSAVDAASKLDTAFETGKYKDQNFKYVIPKFNVSVKMSFSYDNKKIKGLLRKSSSSEKEEVMSSVNFDIVAVPFTEV